MKIDSSPVGGDYSGFGDPILSRSDLGDLYIHENGAWRWCLFGDPEKPCPRSLFDRHVRRAALPVAELSDLRIVLQHALEVVEKQMGGALK